MPRAFIGFSTPIGYDYRNTAERCANDLRSSPNPILFGATGLILLFDELWFACESLCPQNMRKLPFIRFADRESGLAVDRAAIMESFQPDPEDRIGLDAIFDAPYGDGMKRYYGGVGPDNHSHGLEVFGGQFGGNPSPDNLHVDLWLIDRLHEHRLTPALNGLSGRFMFGGGFGYIGDPARKAALQVAIAERLFTTNSIYDIAGVEGPWHPVLEELRDSDHLTSFRAWLDEAPGRFDNYDAAQIAEALDHEISEFNRGALDRHVDSSKLKHTVVEIAGGALMDLVPGSNTVRNVLDILKSRGGLRDRRAAAFAASAQGSIFREHRRATRS